MKWNIICDSSCDIAKLDHLAKDTLFSIAPLTIVVGDKDFTDDNTLNTRNLLDSMAKFKGASTTACPSTAVWMENFEKADYSIAICISSQLSGTYNSALVAKELTLEQHPSKRIHIVNSRATSGIMILLAEKINQLIKQNKSFEEVVTTIESYNNTLELTFCLKSYDTLIKTGRMSPIAGAVASVLGIRAVAKKSPQGEIQVIGKQRGDAAAYKYIVNQMSQMKDLSKCKVIISHCFNAQGAHQIKNLLKEMKNCVDVQVIETHGLCSFYANEGGIIISY